MKHIFRKPLLPCLVLAAALFGSCFMTLFRQSMERDQKTVDELYESVSLYAQVLPGGTAGTLSMRNKTAQALQQTQGVIRTEYWLQCPYSMREPFAAADFATVYGVQGLDFFAEERGVTVSYFDGWEQLCGEGRIPCLMEASLVEWLAIEPGDCLVIAPNQGEAPDSNRAPAFSVQAVGVFTNDQGLVEPFSLIVDAALFTENPGLLYDGNMMGSHYYYRGFRMWTDPAENRAFTALRQTLQQTLDRDGDFILFANDRLLTQAVQPLEQKLRLQQLLVTPLQALFCAAMAAAAVLLANGWSTEIFLRLLLGAGRWKTWCRITGLSWLLLAIAVGLSLLAAVLLGGMQQLSWAAPQMLGSGLLCAAASAVVHGVQCGKNLVKFYQAREDG